MPKTASVTIAVVSHDREQKLRVTLENLRRQSRLPDEVFVLVSGYTPGVFAQLAAENPKALFFREDGDPPDWGHHKREAALSWARSDYIGWWNDDCTYDDSYIEVMMGTAEQTDADVVYCAWNRVPYPHCRFASGASDAGSYIVRTQLARRVGYPQANPKTGFHDYATDGVFIDALAKATEQVVPVNEMLYQHNVQ